MRRENEENIRGIETTHCTKLKEEVRKIKQELEDSYREKINRLESSIVEL